MIHAGLKIPLLPGELIGEMALFEGGSRNADVITNSDTIIGIITYEDLGELAMHNPVIQHKLMLLMASSSIKKLRKTAMQAKVKSPPSKPWRGGPLLIVCRLLRVKGVPIASPRQFL